MNSDRKKGIIFASLGAVLWGASGIAGQYLLINEQIAPEWLTFCRLLLAGVLLLSLLALQGKKIFEIWKDKEDRISILVFSVFGMMATQYGYFASIAESNAPTATVLEYINPILIIFWNCFREKRLPDRLEIGCTFFAVAGTFLVATGGDFGALAISPKALFWGLLAALACAIYTVVPVRIIRKFGSPVVIGWGMFIASLFMGPVAAWTPFTGALSIHVILAFFFVVIFGTILSFCFYLGSVAYIRPAETSIIGAIEPVSSVIFSFFLFHLLFGAWDLLGMALIIAAVILVARK